MARPPPPTYMAIPPPPLPEFYVRTRAASVDSSIQAESTTSIDGTDDRWQYRKATSRTDSIRMQKPTDGVPPLAVYHICRICLRPRSTRYHHEHPIPIDGVPPPPGICRRCRVVSVEDTRTVAQVVEQSESKDVKLGVKCLVSDADYFTNEEMRSRRASHILEHVDRIELEPPPKPQHSKDRRPKEQEEIIYRHVHITPPPPPPPPFPPCPPPPPTPPALDAFAKQKVQNAGGSLSQHSSRREEPKKTEITYVRSGTVPPPSSPPYAAAAAIRKINAAKAPSSISASTSVRSKHTSVRRTSIAEETKPVPSESEIRRLARDEVVRYRQAERKIEKHKDPYAHGRLVPVEQERIPVARRIELQADVAEKMPWHTDDGAETRRDSAFALPKRSHQDKEAERGGREEVVMAYRNRRTEETAQEDIVRAPSSTSSSSSDKTRWPGAEVKRTYRVTEHELPPGDDGKNKARSAHGSVYGVPPRSTAKDSEIVEIIERRELPEERRPNEETRYYKITRRNSDVSDREEELAKKTGSQYRAQTETIRASSPASARSNGRLFERDSEGNLRPLGPRNKTLVIERVDLSEEQPQDLPYPPDDQTPLVMPSPSSHASRPAKNTKSRDQDREYFYMERTVEPVGRFGEKKAEMQPGEYYRETNEYLHRRKPAPEQSIQAKIPAAGPEVKVRRPSDVSSRVRFSNKLDISPTPPGSDASSGQFRNFGGKKKVGVDGQGPESGEDLIAEYERRGRQRSRTPSRAGGFYYERDIVRSHERGYRPMGKDDRDRTPRAYAPSETATGLSTLPSNFGRMARVLSESPSREKLKAAAMRQKSDGLPPYVAPASPAPSVTVEDGSTLTDESEGTYRRVEVHREQPGGRRLKR